MTRNKCKEEYKQKENLDRIIDEQYQIRSDTMMKFLLVAASANIVCPAMVFLLYTELSAGNYTRAVLELGTAGGLIYSGMHCLFKRQNELDARAATLCKELQSLKTSC